MSGNCNGGTLLGELFVTFLRVPGLKKTMWRGWYQFLARRYRGADWTFMNYGFHDDASPALKLESADEPDRYCIQLYHHVAGAMSLEGKRALEVGCGRGGGSSFISRYLRPAQMTGIDLSAEAVAFCKARHNLAGLDFKTGDAEHLPFASETFDAVVNVESSHCYPSLPAFFSEVRRVLKPGGHFFMRIFTTVRTCRSGSPRWSRAGSSSSRNGTSPPTFSPRSIATVIASSR